MGCGTEPCRIIASLGGVDISHLVLLFFWFTEVECVGCVWRGGVAYEGVINLGCILWGPRYPKKRYGVSRGVIRRTSGRDTACLKKWGRGVCFYGFFFGGGLID